LAAVVGIVRGHGGLLEVESELGVGTTMAIYLPVTDRVEDSAHETAPSAPPGSHEHATILLVEDETAARQVARSMLELAGCRVIEARNGREAIETYRARASEISAVLMDLSMPVMGGEPALRELIAIDPEVRAIVISGYAELDTTKKLAGLRPAAFLQKPYRYDQLLEVLRVVVQREGHGPVR
jgi:DNA-binding NtrC family response regulator